jgi:tRNA pseudouridine13 synthase
VSIPELPERLLGEPLRLTADLPGIGGVIKQRLEDFLVEEIPAYLPSGQGEHLYLWIEKRDMGGEYFQRQVAQRLGIAPGDVGTAGIKDRKAITRQWVSVPQKAQDQIKHLEGDGIAVLRVDRHGNKLRPGHLHGNRFEIVIREVTDDKPLEGILARIREFGLPNYYGGQRFGRGHETLRMGWTLMHGGRVQAGHFLRKLALSAVQSALFNLYLSQRMTDGLYRVVQDGEVMGKWPAGGMFITHDPPTEQARFERREVVHMGPIFGSKMRSAGSLAHEREQRLLESLEVRKETFRAGHKLLEGTRRHNLIFIENLKAIAESGAVRLSFSLPAGSYATVLLDEIIKPQTLSLADRDD